MMPAMPATQTTVFNRLTPLLRKPLFWLLALGALLGASVVQAQGIPLINATSAGGGTQYSLTLQLLALMTALTRTYPDQTYLSLFSSPSLLAL